VIVVLGTSHVGSRSGDRPNHPGLSAVFARPDVSVRGRVQREAAAFLRRSPRESDVLPIGGWTYASIPRSARAPTMEAEKPTTVASSERAK
jgi:hypothetical protein